MNSFQAKLITDRTEEYSEHLVQLTQEKEGDRYCREHLLEEIEALSSSLEYFREQETVLALSKTQYYDDYLHALRWYILKSRHNPVHHFSYSAEAVRLMTILEGINRKPAVRIESYQPFRWAVINVRAYDFALKVNPRPADRLSRLSPETTFPWLSILNKHNVPRYKNVHLDRWLKNKAQQEEDDATYKGLGVMLIEEGLNFWYQIQDKILRMSPEISGTISENDEAYLEMVKYTELSVWNTPELEMLSLEQLQAYDEWYLEFFTSL